MATIWNYPTRICFGVGSVLTLGREATQLRARRALIVTDPVLRALGLHEGAAESLRAEGLEVSLFDQVDPNPTEANISAGARALAQHAADLIVGIGGGSALDAAKLIAVRQAVALPFADLDDTRGGDAHIPDHLLPVIAIPTTAGTGSEVGRAAVVLAEHTGLKTVVFKPSMLPRVAILDPEMTRSMPASVTAATGFDALTHCLEALVARGDHPMADAIALMGLELVASHLARAVQDGGDLGARGAMLKAAMMGAVAFQKGLGACHSLAHPLSSEFGTHHGLANALCLPAVVRFNLDAARPAYERAAKALGAPSASELANWLTEFRGELGLRGTLREQGVNEGHLERLSELALKDGCHSGNPRACDRQALRELYHACLG